MAKVRTTIYLSDDVYGYLIKLVGAYTQKYKKIASVSMILKTIVNTFKELIKHVDISNLPSEIKEFVELAKEVS